MQWKKENWDKEDKLYSPKRKVNNSQSKYLPHNIGYLYSNKMKKDVGYESLWGECLFYYCLELDKKTVRYYEQPVKIPIKVWRDGGELSEWEHVPDVLVYREGFHPHLYQIKGGRYSEDQFCHIVNSCIRYAEIMGWGYSVVHPAKALPEVVKSNVLFLTNYIKPRMGFDLMCEHILENVMSINQISIEDLARSFASTVDYRFVLPAIYHLISIGGLYVNWLDKICNKTIITTIKRDANNLEGLFERECLLESKTT